MARIPQQKSEQIAYPTQANTLLAKAALFKVDSLGNILEDTFAPFLLNPDSIEESKIGNWVENTIPGQSDPILQWVSGGARTITFTALITRDGVDLQQASKDFGLANLANMAATVVGSVATALAGVNIPPVGDVVSALLSNKPAEGEELSISRYLDYYRSLMYPVHTQDGILESSPSLVVLALGKTLNSDDTKTYIGKISTNTDLWAVKNLSIRVTKWLPNLTPMEAEVTFSLTEYIISSKSAANFQAPASGDSTSSLPSVSLPFV